MFMRSKRRRDKSIISKDDGKSKKRKEENAVIADRIEIIRLTDLSDEDDEDDDNCDWEDVSELSDSKSVVINMEHILSNDVTKETKQKRQRLDNENDKMICRTTLMSLFARAILVNNISSNDFIQNLAYSRFPSEYMYCNSRNITSKNIHNILLDINIQFNIINDYNESGDINEILIKALQTGNVSALWFNVAVLLILRSKGFTVRLLSILYPRNRTVNNSLIPPTNYRKSTRGFNTNKNRKQTVCLPSTRSSTIIFALEVLSLEENRWISVDSNDLSTFDNTEVLVRDYPRFLYVVSLDNDGYVKDLSPRYDCHWAESSRRLRLSRESWMNILAPFMTQMESEINTLEDESIKAVLLKRGIPRTLADIKGHPLFVLRKHLLKYEVIYPSDIAPFGQFNEEDVFLRDNVKLAHTRETWLKEAMVVKDGEIPCKRVKTMMSTRKQKTHGTDPLVGIFGPWQIEPFVPPKAVNGIVPINSHGNVDLFQPSMIPEGCMHIRTNGIDKVAKKLGIDCAAAMVGWGFVKGHRAVPILDGWVVCKENIKILKDALIEFNRLEAEKYREKRQKIVVKRWEILTRRILLRERLRVEYNF